MSQNRMFPKGTVPASVLKRFFNGGTYRSFIDDLPKAMWPAYGKDSAVLCNGHVLLILPGAFQPPEFEQLREEYQHKQKAPDWQKVMKEVHGRPALVPVTLFGHAISVRGTLPGQQASTFFKKVESSPADTWVWVSCAYTDLIEKWWGCHYGQPEKIGQGDEGPGPIPVIGQDSRGHVCLWGACMPIRRGTLKPGELFHVNQLRRHGKKEVA